jgi:hypothetical protein
MPECLCTVLGPLERAQVWATRAQPTLKRLIARHHRVDSARIQLVMGLVVGFDFKDPRCLDPAFAHHSHHLANCPAAARNRPYNGGSSARAPVTGFGVQNRFLGPGEAAWSDLMTEWRAISSDEPAVRPAAGPSSGAA